MDITNKTSGVIALFELIEIEFLDIETGDKFKRNLPRIPREGETVLFWGGSGEVKSITHEVGDEGTPDEYGVSITLYMLEGKLPRN